jgi:hypothetical protein
MDTGAVSTTRLSVPAPPPWLDTWHIVEAQRAGTAGEFVLEGNLAGTGALTGNFDGSGTAQWGVGWDTSGAWLLGGDLAELIIFNRALTTTERDTVRNYLKAKWGIAQNKLELNPAGTGYLLLNPTSNDRLALN